MVISIHQINEIKKIFFGYKKPINNFDKKIVVDSDKSISIRSFLIGSISQGVSSVKNVLESEDVFSTINCLRKLNIKILNILVIKLIKFLEKD